MEDKEFIGKIFKQNCGDSLLILEKTTNKNKNGNYLFRAYFQKYPYEILVEKRTVLKGSVNNPQIEQVEFIDKIWKQNCGESLKIIEKTNIKNKSGNHYLYRCKFINSDFEVLAEKGNIIKGTIQSPKIEEDFINSIWPQNCGDSIKILEKTNKQYNNEFLYKCIFIKYPYILYKTKSAIKSKHINNPEIENNEFIGNTFIQKNGDKLKVLSKEQNGLFKCEFENQEYTFLATKGEIKRGAYIDKSKFIWNYKDKFENYLKKLKDKNTLIEIAESLQISPTLIGQRINEFNLRKYIKYSPNLQQENFAKYIQSLIKEKIQENKILKDKEGKSSYEIDVYIEFLKLGFEYNGNLWHSDSSKFGKINYCYHQNKSLLAKENNINLFYIWEWEWQNESKHYLYEAYIKSKLNIFKNKVGARSCKIKEISNKEYEQFCEINHLQGKAFAKIKLGLFYKDELVQIMSFSIPRFAENFEYEIIRECSKINWCIIGGKEKLWSYFVKNYSPRNCISYCDFSKFTGESYLKLGFKKERLNKPGFVWWDSKYNQVFWRNPYKNQEMKEKGYLKLFDAGQLVFTWFK